MRAALCVLLALLLLAGCGQNDDPDGAKQLYGKINEGAGYRAWRRAPGFAERKPSFTAHSDAVEIFVSAEISAALDGPDPRTEWPVGSTIVKEGFSGGTRSLIAVMSKRADGWYWAEYGGDGDTLYSGKPSTCTDCHQHRKPTDWVYAFDLPR